MPRAAAGAPAAARGLGSWRRRGRARRAPETSTAPEPPTRTPRRPGPPRPRSAPDRAGGSPSQRCRPLPGQPQNLVDLDLLLLALHLDGAERADLHHVPNQVPVALADEDLPRLGVGLEPRGEVHAVTDHGVLHPVRRAHRPCHRLSRADPDPDGDTLLSLPGPLLVEPVD